MFARSSKRRNFTTALSPADELQRGQPCITCGDQCPGFSLHAWSVPWKTALLSQIL